MEHSEVDRASPAACRNGREQVSALRMDAGAFAGLPLRFVTCNVTAVSDLTTLDSSLADLAPTLGPAAWISQAGTWLCATVINANCQLQNGQWVVVKTTIHARLCHKRYHCLLWLSISPNSLPTANGWQSLGRRTLAASTIRPDARFDRQVSSGIPPPLCPLRNGTPGAQLGNLKCTECDPRSFSKFQKVVLRHSRPCMPLFHATRSGD